MILSQTLELVPLYSKISPVDSSLSYTLPSESSDSLASTEDDFDFPATLIIFSETKALDLTTRFRKDADAFYVEAKRSTVSSIAQIPYWMYGVLVILGWNEAMYVLFNPIYIVFLLIVSATAYVISNTHLGFADASTATSCCNLASSDPQCKSQRRWAARLVPPFPMPHSPALTPLVLGSSTAGDAPARALCAADQHPARAQPDA